MRQVPRYLIIGNGRVAHHFQHYFSLLALSFEVWHRNKPLTQLKQQLNTVSHILILTSDNAIEIIATEYLQDTKAMRLHFSGSHVSDNAYGTHPLMCFNNDLYTLEEYRAIPFVIDHDMPDWEMALPGLQNRHIRLHKSLKAKYHALCVLSGNFSCILWQKLFDSFEQEFNIPQSFSYDYLLKQTQNLISNSSTALTGPLVRDDKITIEKNLMALNSDPFKNIYESFVECYKKMKEVELK